MASAAGSAKPVSSSTSRSVKWEAFSCSMTMMPTTDSRAVSTAYKPEAMLGVRPGPPDLMRLSSRTTPRWAMTVLSGGGSSSSPRCPGSF